MHDILALSELFEKIGELSGGRKLSCFPVHSDVPFEDQMKIFEKVAPNEVRVFLATNTSFASDSANKSNTTKLHTDRFYSLRGYPRLVLLNDLVEQDEYAKALCIGFTPKRFSRHSGALNRVKSSVFLLTPSF